jgi:hypothetical protein
MALRYLVLDGTGPPQPQRTGQHDPPLHNLANNHADDQRLRQIVTGQTLPDAALARPLTAIHGNSRSNGTAPGLCSRRSPVAGTAWHSIANKPRMR